MLQKSYWIWTWGDYEIFHSNRVNSRREEYGADYPCFWRLYDVDRNVKFFYEFTAETDGTIELYVNGIGHFMLDGKRKRSGVNVPIEKGEHTIKVCITNLSGLPAAYIKSDVCTSGKGWYTLDSKMNKIPVGYEECYDSVEKNPEEFPFEYKRIMPVKKQKRPDGVLFEFEKELFGFLNIDNVPPERELCVSYGESVEEALDYENTVLFENVCGKQSYRLRQRAFRYIFIKGAPDADISADFEYLPLEYKGSFECDDAAVNQIWDMCAYTLFVTAREVHLEAIKRDRWLWGGDAYQTYKFDNYLFFDKDIVRRSTIALRGKEPFLEHINTITDYSLYWVIGLWEYYLNFKDIEFIRLIWQRAVSLMKFTNTGRNKDGFITWMEGNWDFVDWSDIDKSGALSAVQILYIAANRTMAQLAELIGEDGEEYSKTAEEMTKKTNEYYWSKERGAYIDTYESGKNHVSRHANIFAIMYGIATEEQKESIIKNVLLNDEITQITTPYFEGYELDTFGMIGNFDYIENKIKTYWKGMLDLGATTVWEEYKPELTGVEHYKKYGGRYGKSLCHAWGAAPVYLLGKYFLGVSPETPGFDTFTVAPHLGGFGYIKGTVPIKDAEVRVYLDGEKLSVTATRGGGTLIWKDKSYELKKNEELVIKL